MDSATWCVTPAAASAARRLRPEVSKNSSTALSSHEGAFATSTTTRAPVSASASPSPVTALTPVEGEAATTSCPRSPRSFTSFFPMSPLPPITTIFMLHLPVCRPERGPLFDLRHRPAGQLVRVVGHVHGPAPALDAQRHDVDDGPAAGENHSRHAVDRRDLHRAIAELPAEHPGEEPRRPLAPRDDRPRRRDLPAAVGEDL